MRLVTFRTNGIDAVGCLLENGIVALKRAAFAFEDRLPATIPPATAAEWLHSMRSLLKAGEQGMDLCRTLQSIPAAELAGAGAWVSLEECELQAPIPDPGKIVCMGQNYIDHCREQGVEPPESPVIFAKMNNTVLPPDQPVRIPPGSTRVDFEAELAFVVGSRASRVGRGDAWRYIAGYLILNDVTERAMQRGDGQWVRGKSCDTFAPMGPCLVTRDEVPDPHNLAIQFRLNGRLMQDSRTSNLIFPIPVIMEFLTNSMTLEPGDIVSTGTPPGVGAFREPPVFLKAGDQMEVLIEGIGVLRNPVQ
jgi:2-keto-4-pentenoate hydratase/2-oxohepta-3-ene-1,7-dioic acid hydratase in catechol pathway